MGPALNILEVEDLEGVEKRLLGCPPLEIETVHHFAPGVYLREAIMPAGAIVLGHAHREAGLNIVLTGAALVKIDGVLKKISAPCIFLSAAGVRKIAYTLEKTRWLNIHPNAKNETDAEALESSNIIKSATFLEHEKNQKITMKTQNAGALN
jgi:hypothetical protein